VALSLKDFVFAVGAAGLVASWGIAMILWFRIVMKFSPYWSEYWRLPSASRNTISMYCFAPISSYDDPIVTIEIRKLLNQLPEIKRRVMHFFVAGISGIAFGLIGAFAQDHL
jgi:hypothetical protein